jgi:beta-phosphoglucomutase-like phosphatase (HAD superfamily)
MSDFDAILFDFDGVLADTEPVHFACWVEALAPLGVPFEWDFFRDHCVGIDDRSMVQLLAARSSPPRDWESLWACHAGKSALFRRRTLASPPFAPELGGFLKGLHGAYKLAVVTASPRPEIEPLLAAGGLGAYFDALVCGKEAGRHKPAPDPYLHAGVASGRAAGFEVLAVESAAGMQEAVLRQLSFVDNPEKSAPG